MSNTIIAIQGREDQTIADVIMTEEQIRSAFSGSIDLSGMTATTTIESRTGDTTVDFKNKVGTKGTGNVVIENLVINGDVTLNTRICIQGREDQVIPDAVLTPGDVIAAFASEVDLSGMDFTEEDSGDAHVISFVNRVGTKGNDDLLASAFNILNAMPAVEAEAEQVVVTNTKILIPGREEQIINDMVMDTATVRTSFNGLIDLSGFDVEEYEEGTYLVVKFTTRTGTKGA